MSATNAYCEIQVGGHIGNSRRGVALVDHVDAEAVGAYRWHMHSNGYAKRNAPIGGKQMTEYLHRFLLGMAPGDPRHIDHISGDKLDNRRANLRVATNAQNCQNLHTLPYRGTCWDPSRGLWQARAQVAGKNHHLGRFATREEAAEVAAAFRREQAINRDGFKSHGLSEGAVLQGLDGRVWRVLGPATLRGSDALVRVENVATGKREHRYARTVALWAEAA